MAWGRSNETWNHTSSLMALFAAMHTDPDKGTPPQPADFHPYLPTPEVPEATPAMLRAMGLGKFVPKGAK
jgi:hypothetical protein